MFGCEDEPEPKDCAGVEGRKIIIDYIKTYRDKCDTKGVKKI